MKHRVRVHQWFGGILKVLDHFFEEEDAAVEFAQNCGGNLVKVFNPENEVTHHYRSGVDYSSMYATYA
jgi:hypothetical protein